jgi:hypothetical protein
MALSVSLLPQFDHLLTNLISRFFSQPFLFLFLLRTQLQNMKIFYSPLLALFTFASWAGPHMIIEAQCEVPGNALDKCLDQYLTSAQEEVCGNCIDMAGLTLAANEECDNPSFCAALEACAEDCGAAAVPCFDLMPAKFLCELNDERTTEPPIFSECPAFTCTGGIDNDGTTAGTSPGTMNDNFLLQDSADSAAHPKTGIVIGTSLLFLLLGVLM